MNIIKTSIEENANINELNKVYEENALNYPYPFISAYRITVLRKGLYKKKNAKYYGFSIFYNQTQKELECALMGYMYVNKNLIVIPEGKVLQDKDLAFVKKFIKKGYKVINEFPKLKNLIFDKDTPEYKIALENYKSFHKK